MERDLPNWKLIDLATKTLVSQSPDGTFTRREIIDYINHRLLKGQEPRNESSLNPMIQAVTVNAPGGAPGGLDKNLLYRVGRGIYKRYDLSTDALEDNEVGIPVDETLSNRSDLGVPFGRVDERGFIALPRVIIEELNLEPGSLVAFVRNRDGDITLKRGQLKPEVLE